MKSQREGPGGGGAGGRRIELIDLDVIFKIEGLKQNNFKFLYLCVK